MSRSSAKWFRVPLVFLTVAFFDAQGSFLLAAAGAKPEARGKVVQSTTIPVVQWGLSKPLRDLKPSPPTPHSKDGKNLREMPDKPPQLHPLPNQPKPYDSLVQTEKGSKLIPSPIVNFDGIGDRDGVQPPDTQMDVSDTQIVDWVNLSYEVLDKSGNLLAGPFEGTNFWNGLAGSPCSTFNGGDVLVRWDQFASQWFVSQLAYPGGNQGFHECVAVSTTNDATGSYYQFDYLYSPTDLNDYPKVGLWPVSGSGPDATGNGYYITVRNFANFSFFTGMEIIAFDRAALLAGSPVNAQVFDVGALAPNLDGLLPADLRGTNVPAGDSLETFIGYGSPQTDGSSSTVLHLFQTFVDFDNAANSTLTQLSDISVASFDPVLNSAPQVGAGSLEVLPFSMYRADYRVFLNSDGSFNHDSLLNLHDVNVAGTCGGGEQGGSRWHEVQGISAGGPPFLYQEGTYGPCDNTYRWMGSIAQDGSGDIALGFSASSDGSGIVNDPSVHYTGRLATDPLGKMPQGEGSFIDSTQAFGGFRWGDYSAMLVDPVDQCTFWYTTEYGAGDWKTRIGSFKFSDCVTGPSGTLQGTVTDTASNPIGGASVTAGAYSTLTNPSGHYTLILPVGTFTVTVTALGYAPGGGTVVITDGGTTVFDVSLTQVPILVSAGTTLTAETCQPPNGMIDPGEAVTITVCVKNIGQASTTNLVGTLEETGGVTQAGPPQTFGVVPPGGTAVCRDFTFTADPALPCGGTVTATVDLLDGASALGSVSGTFTTGAVNVVFTEAFDGVTVPALPPGWTATNAAGPSPLWVTTIYTVDTPPNAAHVDDPNVVADKRLDSPNIWIVSGSAQFSFRHTYALQGGFDGGVLEISIGGGAFEDILAAGGSFVSGGYNGTLASGRGNPIGGRQAWTGFSGYLTTTVNLPASALGQSIQLRWRMGSDKSVGSTGWTIDTVSITEGYVCCSVTPTALSVDAHSAAGTSSNLNGVLEPGESVLVSPSWFNGMAAPVSLSGTASVFTGPSGASYTITDSSADYGSIASAAAVDCYGSTGDCYVLTVSNPAVRPAAHWDAHFLETPTLGLPKIWILHVGNSFADVPNSDPFYSFIETILHNDVTAGCGNGDYCPTDSVTRAQMAVFLLKAQHGSSYSPPPCMGIFQDVPCPAGFAVDWIEQLYNEGVTAGCSANPPLYCPDDPVTRAQMAVFLLTAEHGSGYSPPACTGIFQDVPCPTGFAVDWIEQLYNEGVTAGCQVAPPLYCPDDSNTRGQMAVFLTKTFALRLYGP